MVCPLKVLHTQEREHSRKKPLHKRIWNKSNDVREGKVLMETYAQDYIDCKRSLGTQNMSLFKPSQRVKALSNALA